MYAYITISNVGTDAGPFNLYSDVDGYASAFQTNIPKTSLEAGYFVDNVPVGTKEIRVQSVNPLCTNYKNVGVTPLEYFFVPRNTDTFIADFINKGTYAIVYGSFLGYNNGSYEVPGNHIVKLNPDLSVDTSFDVGEGFDSHQMYIGATLTELSDGSVILVGYFTSYSGQSYNRIIKLNPDGSINNTFNVGTGFNDYTTGISQTTDDKYYISGIYSQYNNFSSPRIIRLLNDGSIDYSFNVGGGFNNASLDTLVNFDNSVYVSGYFSTYKGQNAPGIIKLLPNGDIDTSFDPGVGFKQNGAYRGVLMARIPGEDSVLCVTYCFYGYCGAGVNYLTYRGVNYGNIVKLLPNGDPDPNFNPGGAGFNAAVSLVSIVFGDKILVTSNPDFTYNGVPSKSIILLNADGSILQTFPTVSYSFVYAIGNTLYGTDYSGTGHNQVIYEYTGDVTTTTTTTTV